MHKLQISNYGDEHISELVPQSKKPYPKPPRYQSNFKKSIKTNLKKEKHAAKTMGSIATQPPNSKNYLKKNGGHTALRISSQIENQKNKKMRLNLLNENNKNEKRKNKNSSHTFLYSRCQEEKSPIIIKPPRDIIVENAIRNKTSIPKLSNQKIYVDSTNGHKNDLLKSGLVPHYSNKENYGKVPDYIKNRKKLVEETEKSFDKFMMEQSNNQSLKKISQNEHDNVLKNLKSKWDNLHHEYQGLSVVTDTAPKKNRKEKLENDMSQIEKDIIFMERNCVIYVERS
jgi:hypothetical protein